MTEEFVLKKRLGNGRTVDGHERTVAARGELMNRTSEQLLPGSALPENQHRALAGRHALNLKQCFLEALAGPDQSRQRHPRLKLFFQEDGASLQAAAVEGAVHQQEKVVGVDGLGEEIGSALPDGAHRIFDRTVGRHHNDVGFRTRLQRRFDDVEPGPRGELEVGQDNAEGGS